ncbi:hypothetical protein HMP0721_0545 [Pseudoramibacter alactolyticus ATCC 23263]|jgi:hypothetical protein|uniref:Uncharacterized protein n=1 Tax=Pseudoramibacter alactolyticus ATCC 23263 TaxID=887929 RepID=E6MEW2_9FIRM|nr:hypothetical protein [Pseudoramibacter alactolyticus]EFV02400.1 hypothetical protein HMP0721_0545 [Pseudoramibacter alactolyticus ATCC 23263]MBM6967658.1 hypothetical protein [Pseudoramibacter alactolyticus]
METVQTNFIYQRIRDELFEREKCIHSISYPVIRKVKDQYYLAVFIDHYDLQELMDNQITRPDEWALADLESGKITEVYQCKIYDFCDKASIPQTMAVSREGMKTDQHYFQQLFHRLDQIRDEILMGQGFNEDLYNTYLATVIEQVPESMAYFYRALSKTGDDIGED